MNPEALPPRRTSTLEVSNALGLVVLEAERQAGEPYAQDPFFGAFAQATYDELTSSDSPFAAPILEVVRQHHSLAVPTQLLNHVARALQEDSIRRHPRAYPIKKHLYPETWRHQEREIANDPVRLERFYMFMSDFLMSTVDERYKMLQIFAPLFGKGLDSDKPVDVIDYGSSINIGGKKVMLKQRYPFETLNVGEHVIETTPDGERHHLVGNPELTNTVGSLLVSKLAIVNWVGVDRQVGTRFDDAKRDNTPDYQNLIRKALSSSFYPKEIYFNIPRYKNFKELARKNVPNLHTVGSDFTSWGVEHFLERSPVKSFDIAYASTVLHMLHPDEREAVIDGLLNVLKPDGVIFILDFAYKDEQGQLAVHPQWTEYTYNLFAIEAKSPKNLVHLANINGGRVTHAEFTPTALELLHAHLTRRLNS